MNFQIIYFKDKDETRRVKIIRLNTRATNREKDFSMSVDLKVISYFLLKQKQNQVFLEYVDSLRL